MLYGKYITTKQMFNPLLTIWQLMGSGFQTFRYSIQSFRHRSVSLINGANAFRT